MDKPDIHIPHFPTYTNARSFLKLIEGHSRRTVSGIRQKILDHIGTPQEQRDWTQPDQWIPEILNGNEYELALLLWTQGRINPRHMLGLWLMCSSYQLCKTDVNDVLSITEKGFDFLQNDVGISVQHIDFSEGLLELLVIIAEHGPAKRSELLPHFRDFLLANSKRQATSVVNSTWYDRIANLIERGFVRRDRVDYTIEPKGVSYLDQVHHLLQQNGNAILQTGSDLRKFLEKQTSEVRKELLQTLRQLENPIQLEYIVKSLLEAMGYENVEVTKASGDYGVDVVADINIGITHIREVVQVKRYQRNIQRPVLDNLRGSLHRFDAYRGTIISTGGFSKGAIDATFEKGAAPITLIDGDRLVDLLIEHEIGVRKEAVQILKFQLSDFNVNDNGFVE